MNGQKTIRWQKEASRDQGGGLRILVCMKQVLDPDVPARDFRIDGSRNEAERGGASLVPNIFCENALETALQLRDATDGSVTAVSFGTEEAEDVVRKALAMTVDEAALVTRPEGPAPDPLVVAKVLAGAARRLGEFDVVMVGRESGDWGGGFSEESADRVRWWWTAASCRRLPFAAQQQSA